MQQQGCWLGQKSGSISLPFLLPFTGCQYNKGSFSRLFLWCSKPSMARPHHTYHTFYTPIQPPGPLDPLIRSSTHPPLQTETKRWPGLRCSCSALVEPTATRHMWCPLHLCLKIKAQNPSVQPCLPSPSTIWPLHYCLCCVWMSGFMSFSCILFYCYFAIIFACWVHYVQHFGQCKLF